MRLSVGMGLGVLLLAPVGACLPHSHVETPAGALLAAVPYRADRSIDPTPYSREELLRAAGLPALSQARLPEGYRELRAWPSHGPVVPDRLMRVVQGPEGSTVEWIQYWRNSSVESFRDRFVSGLRESGRCTEIHRVGNYEICEPHRQRGAEAARIVAILDSLGAWQAVAPDGAGLLFREAEGMIVKQADGMALTVEVLQGAHYRTATFGQHFLQSESPDSRTAAETYRIAGQC